MSGPMTGPTAAAPSPSPAPAGSRFSMRRRVEFVDTDAGGIVHFSRFFIFMETTEHLFLEAHGLSVHERVEGVLVSWPRVSATCEYLSPARFGDHLDVHLAVERLGGSSVTYALEFRRGDALLARGRTVAVCCAMEPAGPRPIPIPERFRRAMRGD